MMLKDRKFVVMVGLSGSGKSTCAEKLAAKIILNYPVFDGCYRANIVDIISSDKIREEILGDVNDQTANDKVFAEIHKRIRAGLESYHHIIIDATNLSVKSRKGILQTFNNVHENYRCMYTPIAYVMTTPFSLVLQQNAERERVVPQKVISRQIGEFEIPFYEEGFERIILDGYQCNDVDAEVFDGVTHVFNSMKGFDQRNSHHQFDLATHCKMLWRSLLYFDCLGWAQEKILLKAALLHDYGKKFTATPKPSLNGEYRYLQHHNIGTYMLLQNVDTFRMKTWHDTMDLLFYINYHMFPFNWSEQKTHEKYKKLFGETKYKNLILFNECDKFASGTYINLADDNAVTDWVDRVVTEYLKK